MGIISWAQGVLGVNPQHQRAALVLGGAGVLAGAVGTALAVEAHRSLGDAKSPSKDSLRGRIAAQETDVREVRKDLADVRTENLEARKGLEGKIAGLAARVDSLAVEVAHCAASSSVDELRVEIAELRTQTVDGGAGLAARIQAVEAWVVLAERAQARKAAAAAAPAAPAAPAARRRAGTDRGELVSPPTVIPTIPAPAPANANPARPRRGSAGAAAPADPPTVPAP
jgi:hypothetical protein